MKFAKAHGLGNDFILIAASDAPDDVSPWARRICDRHRGIGGDGVVLYAPYPTGVTMTLLNADGLDGEISGNGLRCLAALAVSRGIAGPEHVVQTPVGPCAVRVSRSGGSTFTIETDLGPPRLRSSEIPILLDPPRETVVDLPIEVAGRTVRATVTSMGNPHCALFLDEVADDALVAALGAPLERHPLFPKRTNVELITVVGRDEVRVRFWERGVGPTQASGTGSASAVVASILTGRTDRRVRAVCDGGTLEVAWPEGGSVSQRGEAELLFEGDLLS